MGVAKFDDGIPDNPKFIAAGPIASWLWFCGVLYCRRALTDGFIPKQKVPTLVVGLPQPYKHATVLVTVKLWDEAVGGYQVHDYLEWNPTKATVEDYRRRDKERKHKQNPNRIPDGFQSGSVTDSERRGASHAGAKSTSASESTSEDQDLRGESVREGALVPFSQKPEGIINGAELRRHGQHAWCSWPTRDGLCVPVFLHQEFVGKLGTTTADVDLRLWYPLVVARYEGRSISDDAIKFWRNTFPEIAGAPVTSPPASSKGQQTLDAARRVLQARLGGAS